MNGDDISCAGQRRALQSLARLGGVRRRHGLSRPLRQRSIQQRGQTAQDVAALARFAQFERGADAPRLPRGSP